MATQKQIEANRRNAQKSTGPKTEEGKSRVAFNGLKHGMTAATAVLPFEDARSYDLLRDYLNDTYHPDGPTEHMLVELVAVSYWRLLRARRVETSSFDLHIRTMKWRNDINQAPHFEDDACLATAFAADTDTLTKLDRYQAGVERSYYRALENLRKAQTERRREERRKADATQTCDTPKIGFASQSVASTATQPPAASQPPSPGEQSRYSPQPDAPFLPLQDRITLPIVHIDQGQLPLRE